VFFLISSFEIDVSKKREERGRPLVVKLKNDQKLNNQIVYSDESENDKAQDDAFLSDKNRSFERQTKAKIVDSFNKGASSSKGPVQKKKKLGLSDLGKAVNSDPFKAAAKDYSESKNGDKQNLNHKVSSTSDYIKDIPHGDLTNLNTVEYKYFGFYHRIRQKLEQFWGRSLKKKNEEMAEQGRVLPQSSEFMSVLKVILDRDGNIISVILSTTSGIKELDDAAIESFHEAAPFPNPPKDLIENGRLTLEWGFVVKED
jgi:protein TonB